MAHLTILKILRKAGAFTGGDLAAGELGLDTTNDKLYASSDGTTVYAINSATAFGESLIAAADAAAAQAVLDLEPGTDVLAYDATLDTVTAARVLGRGSLFGNGAPEFISFGSAFSFVGQEINLLPDYLLGADNLSTVDNVATAFANLKQDATTSATGVVELATQGEVDTGTDAVRAVTPATLANYSGLGGGAADSVTKDITQASHGFAVGDLLYDNAGTWTKAQADAGATAEVIGIVSAVDGANDFTLTTHGHVTGLTGLTANTTYFLSDATAGLLTTTEPSDDGDISKPVLWADSTTSGYFINYRGMAVGVSDGLQISWAASDETTDLATGTAQLTFRMPFAMTVSEIRATVGTAPTGSALTLDVNEDGTSILSTKLTIDATEKTSTTAAAPAVFSDTFLADDAEITVDVDAIGSTVAGAGLKLHFIGAGPAYEAIGVVVTGETTDIATGTGIITFRMPFAMNLNEVRATFTTAPTGSAATFDINEGGTSVLSTKLSVDATEKTSTTAATPAVISDSLLADDAEMTIDVDAVGSTVAGAGAKVWLIGTRV